MTFIYCGFLNHLYFHVWIYILMNQHFLRLNPPSEKYSGAEGSKHNIIDFTTQNNIQLFATTQ